VIVPSLLNQLVELTGNASNAFTIALYKVDPDDNVLALRHYVSLSSNFDTEAIIAFGEGPIGTVAQSKQPYLDEHFDQDSTILGIYKKNEDLKSFLALPVVYKKLEGVLVIDSKESYSLPTKQQKIISGLANQMAWYLNQEKRETLGEEPPESLFRDLISYCRHITESPEKANVMERLMNVPPSILPCDGYAVIWFDSDKRGKVSKYRGFNKSVANIAIHLGKGLAGSCAKNQCPVILRNIADRHTVIFGTEEEKEPFLSLIAAPIVFNNHLYGVVICGSNNAESFSELELNSLTLMAYSAATAIFCGTTREQWNYNKNLDQITGIPNHRFLTEYAAELEEDIFKNRNPACFLSLQVSNLPELYLSFGVKHGDQLQRGIASTLSKILPSPKYIFKFSETTYIVILISQERSSALLLKEKLKLVFNKAPLFIDGHAMKLNTKLGMSCFPDNGKTLSQLIGTSLTKTTLKASVETIITQ